ncbi:MAG: hypothetical protein KTR15_07395 [Phycisphaeraceae bacterium]|nr:hypothetical protein [Phycisphaeraceae bacterium]
MDQDGIVFGDNDSELSQVFHTRVQTSMVYIERTCLQSQSTFTGTGTIIGYSGNSDYGWQPCIATAAHVIEPAPNAESHFVIKQFDWTDSANPSCRKLEFTTGSVGERSPTAIYYTGPNSEKMDIGFIRAPKTCIDGSDYFKIGSDGLPSSRLLSIPPEECYTAEGTRVAWAGFPGLANEFAKRPQPCYFEGCVSSLILRSDFQAYLIDGHNTFGVSGGPVWAIDSNNEPSIIGIISGYNYLQSSLQMPGFVHAVPIAPLRIFLTKVWKAKLLPSAAPRA